MPVEIHFRQKNSVVEKLLRINSNECAESSAIKCDFALVYEKHAPSGKKLGTPKNRVALDYEKMTDPTEAWRSSIHEYVWQICHVYCVHVWTAFILFIMNAMRRSMFGNSNAIRYNFNHWCCCINMQMTTNFQLNQLLLALDFHIVNHAGNLKCLFCFVLYILIRTIWIARGA